MSARPKKKRIGLEAKAVLGLLTIAIVPLAVSAVLVGQIAQVASSVAESEVDRLREPLTHARDAYAEAVDARKESFDRAAKLVAVDPGLGNLCASRAAPTEVAAALRQLTAADPTLVSIALFRQGAGEPRAQRIAVIQRRMREPMHVLTRSEPLRYAGECTVVTSWATPAYYKEALESLKRTLDKEALLDQARHGLPKGYRIAFVLLVGGVVMGTTLVAIFVARRTTRRLDRLVVATRRVGEGDLEARAGLSGNDELTDLSRAFDQMVADLTKSRAEIEYLQKIGAWQEVARRLAHEIKNPLTPIQLAVQQLHGKYAGDDPRFKKLLDDANEIVTEEVGGLRRLVDAFSGFAKLPRVEPKPLDLALVVEDVRRELPADHLPVEVAPPGQPIAVLADRLLLRRALVNLVENAQQAGAKRVLATWWRDGGVARMTIDDDGPGVPAELRGRLFDPYVTTKEHGTGLGLAIVKKTLLEHGGDVILADGRSPLGGARFELTLPLAI